MSKLTAAIRSQLVVFPYVEAKAPSSRSLRPLLAPIVQDLQIAWRSRGVESAREKIPH